MTCPTAGPITPVMKNWEACPPLRRSSSAWSANRGVLWRLLLLRPDLPPGPYRPSEKPRIHSCRGRKNGQRPGLQGLHPRCGRPHRPTSGTAREKQMTKGACGGRQSLYPTPCKNMNADHSDYVALLRKPRKSRCQEGSFAAAFALTIFGPTLRHLLPSW